jgi:hypothetical protein
MVVVVLLAIAILAPWGRAVAKERGKAKEEAASDAKHAGKPVAMKSRKEIALALRRLAVTPPPATQSYGASCYAPVARPDYVETYVCPKDGARVVYRAQDTLGPVARSIASLRGQVKQLRGQGLDLTLDESALCPKCAKPGQAAQVDLLIHFPDAPEHRHSGVTTRDLDLLQEFLAGTGIHRLDGPDTAPLRSFLPGLRKLLGIPDGLDRAELAKRLQALPVAPPQALATGASCYKPSMPPATVDYVCPHDGQRTHYARGAHSYQTVRELPTLRTIAEPLRAQGISLDEVELCRKCRPDVKSPSLVLVVRFRDDAEVRTREVTRDDLVLLQEFFAGKAVHDRGPNGESLLREHSERLRALLGLPAEGNQP